MKTLLKYILLAFLPLFSSCTGAGLQSGEKHEEESLDPSSYYIYADKTSIESDGMDEAVFFIKNGKGDVVSTYENMGSVFYKNVETGIRLPRYSESFTSIRDGEYEFVGIYKGNETVNSVKVISSNRTSYEKYHKNVAVFKLTATTCPKCPRMTESLNMLDDDAKEHSIVIACHNADKFSVQCGRNDLAAAAALKVEPNLTYLGLPSLIYDMSFMGTSVATSAISSSIMERRVASPAEVGIRISSFILDGNVLKLKASMKADRSGRYDMTAAVLADGLYEPTGYSVDGYYNDVAVAINEANFLAYDNSTGVAMNKDEESERVFTFTFDGQAPSADVLARFRGVILVHTKYDDGHSEINNSAVAPYGGSVDYILN